MSGVNKSQGKDSTFNCFEGFFSETTANITKELGPGRRDLGLVTTDGEEQGGGPRTSGRLWVLESEGGTSGFTVSLKYAVLHRRLWGL